MQRRRMLEQDLLPCQPFPNHARAPTFTVFLDLGMHSSSPT